MNTKNKTINDSAEMVATTCGAASTDSATAATAATASTASTDTTSAVFKTSSTATILAAASAASADDDVVHGIQLANMDLTVDPGSNFQLFCNGTWLNQTDIPDAYPRWGMFMKLRDDSLNYLVALFRRLASTTCEPGSNAQKIGDLFASGMNEDQIEAEGIAALVPELTRIARVRNISELTKAVARLHQINVRVFFDFGADNDADDSDSMIADASQSGTALARDYYLKKDKDTREKRALYLKTIEGYFILLGEQPSVATRHARAVLDIETALARVSMDNETLREPSNTRNKMTVAKFQKLCPVLPVMLYLNERDAPAFDIINVEQPGFFKGLHKLLKKQPMWALRCYMRYHVVAGMAPFLPKRFVDHSFAFNGTVMQGTKVQQERWKRATSLVSGALGEAVGEFYVADNFPPEAKAMMLEMNAAEKEAMQQMFAEMKWMSPATRDYAIKKLEAFVCNVGYPDKWRDYSALQIDRQSYAGNILNVARFGSRRNLEKIGGKVDRGDWGMTPQTVNAQCSQSKNMTFFPAAILQPPFFDMRADFAFNLGGIGAVIGHEDWHNYDDKGAKFDLKGNLANWWLPQDEKNFAALMQKIKDLYEGFVVIPAADGKDAVHMKGGLVCGEAISDLMGLRIAYRALQLMIAKHGRTTVNGYTDEQRFFIAYGQIWASKARPAYEAWQAANDPHPIERFRVNGTLANMPEFRAAFNLPADCAMVLPDHLRCDLLSGPSESDAV